ncbi:hypothetical protein B0H19DRAFT_1259043 [Mycena capillaripes]|nr:hypothetical protein B0H19DRAFT_1259043 [Mycena capillaripes]
MYPFRRRIYPVFAEFVDDPATCTNVSNGHSVIMDLDDDCTPYSFVDCSDGVTIGVAIEIVQNTVLTSNLPPDIKSITAASVSMGW